MSVLFTLVLGALANASLAELLRYSFGAPGRIFWAYGRWLARLEIARRNADGEPVAHVLWRPLGGCGLCFTVWLAWFTYWALPLPLGLATPVWLLFYLGLSALAWNRLGWA